MAKSRSNREAIYEDNKSIGLNPLLDDEKENQPIFAERSFSYFSLCPGLYLERLIYDDDSDTTSLCLRFPMYRMHSEQALPLTKMLKANSFITSLDIEGDEDGIGEQIGYNGARALAKILGSKKYTLSTLRVSCGRLRDEGVEVLSDGLRMNNTLTSLDISFNYVGAQGIKALAQVLELNKAIVTLDISCNSIRHEGIKHIALMLTVNRTITSLNVGSNSLKDEGVKDLTEALDANRTLAYLDVGNNGIGYKGIEALTNTLMINRTLTGLKIDLDGIGNEEIATLVKGLTVNKTLASLDISDNCIGNTGVQALASMMESNYILINLVIDDFDTGEEGAQACKAINKLLNRNKEILIKTAKAFTKIDDEIISNRLNKIEDPKDIIAYRKVLKYYQKCSKVKLKDEMLKAHSLLSFKIQGYYKHYLQKPLGQEKYFKKLFDNVDLDIARNYFKYADVVRSYNFHVHLAKQGETGSLWVIKLPVVLMKSILSFLGSHSLWLGKEENAYLKPELLQEAHNKYFDSLSGYSSVSNEDSTHILTSPESTISNSSYTIPVVGDATEF